MTFPISKFAGLTDNKPERAELDLAELGTMLTTFTERDSKGGALWSPTVYPTRATRKAALVEAVTCLVLDFDSGVHWDEFLGSWATFTFIVHTTFSHSDNKPKWRAVFPLLAPVPAADWAETYARLAVVLSRANADPACKDPSRIYFLPTAAPGAPHFTKCHKGRLLDPVTDFAELPETADAPDKKVGDDYDERVSWEEVMEPAGFRLVEGHLYQGSKMWSRPGKEPKVGEHGALTGPCNSGDRCRFLTSTDIPAEFVGKPLRKWATYAVLRHHGDFRAAIRDLAGRGFGSQTRKTRTKERVTVAVDDKPAIQVNNRDHYALVMDCLNLLRLKNDPPQFFMRSDRPTRIEDGEKGPVIRDLNAHSVRGELTSLATFYRKNADGERECAPPTEVIETLLALPIQDFKFPILKGISTCPTLAGPNIVYRPGYIARTKTYGAFDEIFSPSELSATECAKIILDQVLGDFPFADDASRAHALALMLLPIVLPDLDGLAPMTIVDAPTPGTGKTLLARVCLAVGLGEDPPTTTLSPDEADVSKKLFAALMGGARTFFLDNLKFKLNSGVLAQVLTSGRLSDRILGVSQMASVDAKTIFVATSNNVKLDRDMARRSVWIRLDSHIEDPETRSGFKQKNIMQYVKKERSYLVSLLTKMVEAWLIAGSPLSDKKKGSYEDWTGKIGGILEVSGISGYLDNEEQLKEMAVEDDGDWKAFVAAWAEAFGPKPVTSKQLAELAKEGNYLESLLSRAKDEKYVPMVLGKGLGKVMGRVFGTFQITKSPKYNGDYRFKLEGNEESGGHWGTLYPTREKPVDLFHDDRAIKSEKKAIEANNPPSPPDGANQVQNPGGLPSGDEYDPYTDE